MDKAERKTGKYKISFFVLLVLMGCTFWIFFREFNFYDITEKIKESAHKPYLLGACGLVIVYLFFYGRFIHIGVHSHGEKVSMFNCFIYGCMDFFYSAITPSAGGGQPAVIYYMSKDGISYSTSTIVVILQTAAFKIVLLVYNILAFIFIPKIILGSKAIFLIPLALGAVVSASAIALCFISMYKTSVTRKVGCAVIRFFARIKLFKNPEKRLETFEQTLREYKAAAELISTKKFMLAHMFVVTFLQRTAIYFVSYLIYRSFNLNTYGFLHILCLQASVSLAVDSLPVPGGMGANEIALYLLYENIYGTDESLIGAAVLLTRGINYFFALLVSSVFTMGKHFSLHSRSKKLKGG